MSVQHTLRSDVHVEGITLRTGRPASVHLHPAPPHHGVVFRRGGTDIPARIESVVDTRLATTLGRGGVTIAMVEHLCAALSGAGVDNALVEVDGDELPILDGSAAPWLAAMESEPQAAARIPWYVEEVVEVRLPNGWARVEPAERFLLDITVDFPHPAIGVQTYRGAGSDFARDLAWARTFGFHADAESLRAAGLAQGASLANTVVFDAAGIMNPEGLRGPDEVVRHKALDAVGDLFLLGAPLHGRLVTHRGGHTVHHALLRALQRRRQPDAIAAR